MRIKAAVRVAPGTAWKPTGQRIITRRRIVIEGQTETWRQADHRKRPGPSAPLSACGLCLSLLPANTGFQLLGGRSVGDSNESDSAVPFLPRSLLSKFLSLCLCPFPVSLSLCPSLCSVSLCLSPPPAALGALSPCLPLPQISPLLNHLIIVPL